MPSQDKLIKQGILLTDTTFDEIIKRLQNGVKTSDTLEAFLTKHKEVIVDNPLVAIGYKDKLTEIILQETNNHKFSRPAQKELTRLTIENRVGDLITNVGDDIKQDVRDIVSDGYNNNLSQDEIAANISDSISKIKNTRARVIARTEIARTATASDYVINKERGATHFKVDCRDTCCPVCAERYNWAKNEFSIDDVGMLPPLHPNCRCYAMFFIKDDEDDGSNKATTTTTNISEPTKKSNDIKTRLSGEPKIKKSMANDGTTNTSYTFDSGLELVINSKSEFTFEDIVNHINNLPEPLRNIPTLNKITIMEKGDPKAAGMFYPRNDNVELFIGNISKSDKLNSLTHELAHALDHSKSDKMDHFGLSSVDIYDKIFKEDNKLHEYTTARGKKRIPNTFPTTYAGRSWKKYKRKFSERLKIWKNGSQNESFKPHDFRYGEDFAESTKLYLNPKTHKKFIKDYPNRAKYLESIYGKPKFNEDSPLSRFLKEEKEVGNKKLKQALREEELNDKFDNLTKKELDKHLERVLGGDKRKVEAYHKLRKDERKLYSVQRAITIGDMKEGVGILTKAGWDKNIAEDIMKNPNNYLPKVNAKKRKVSSLLQRVEKLVKSQL